LRSGVWRAGFAALRVVMGFGALWAAWRVLGRALVLATNWPIWLIAAVAAGAVEASLGLYALERRRLARRPALALAAMRIALVLLVAGMLLQPVLSLRRTERTRRHVAILVDDSASMGVADTQLTPAERIRLAEMFLGDELPEVRRAHRLEEVAGKLDEVRGALAAEADWLHALGAVKGDARQRQLEARRGAMNRLFNEAVKSLNDQVGRLTEALEGGVELDSRTRAGIRDAKARLTVKAGARLASAAKMTEPDKSKDLARQYKRMLQEVRQATAALDELPEELSRLGEAMDEALYASLAPDVRLRVDAAVRIPRRALVRRLLTGRAAGQGDAEGRLGLLSSLADKYAVNVYRFASKAAEIDARQLLAGAGAGERNPPSDARGSTSISPRDEGDQRTDLAGAVQKVMLDIPARRLAGILVFSDGRHNAANRVEPLVRQLGSRRIPVCSVMIGSARPPRDAAVVAVETPETINVSDKVYATAEVKLDGLAGEEVRVAMYTADGREVDFKVLRPATDAFRGHVELAHKPGRPGLHTYRIMVQAFEDEAFKTNNSYPVSVSVRDDPMELLIIEGRPRWEFRYLKNLFAGRDRTVELQTVLLNPDRIAMQPAPPTVPASASRPREKVEATALPESQAEWMKFDVIILGDVDPKALGVAGMEALRKFVTDRAGSLIVIAGPNFMPHAYLGSALEEILPVAFDPAGGFAGPGGRSFRLSLTEAGRRSVIMRQRADPRRSGEVWDSLPSIYWRHPTARAKPAATVLAYALPPSPGEYIKPAKANPAGGAGASDEEARKRREFERANALITVHNVALGRVMFLGFDRTWRLRYRVGDTYHHKFWGQVLRWATAEKLPAGTRLVKIGTDRSRYSNNQHVSVRAKITRPDLSPVISTEVAARVTAGGRTVRRRMMQYVPDSPGIYQADLGTFDGGTYRVELDCPAVLGPSGETGLKPIACEFSVEQTVPIEQVELSADAGLLGRMAELSGGIVLPPWRSGRMVDAFGRGVLENIRRRQMQIWDSWPLLGLIVLLATGEWLVRKKVGLA